MPHRKKLIEIALPLEAINLESAREKSIRHGHPSTLHLWWARRPLAACRAVLWASLVDDPSSWPDKFPTEADQTRERQRLFDILGRIETETDKKGNQKQVVRGLVSWDEVNDAKSGVLEAAQREIARCLAWERGEEPPKKPDAVRAYIAKYAPPVYDPFAGGGSIPLEAQRLGLEAHASDLNPVAVLINKALIEIPPKFKDKSPVNPEDRAKKSISSWRGAQGLAADVRFYGAWMRERAFERIGHLYPKVRIGNHGGTEGTEATVIAWLWARTVTCPNPACGCAMPLVRSFQLSTKKGKEAWVEPIVENMNHGDTESTEQPLRDLRASVVNKIRFVVKSGQGKAPEGSMSRKGAVCIACKTPVPFEYIRSEGCRVGMGSQLMAIVAEGKSGRVYLSPDEYHVEVANSAQPTWKPEAELPDNTRDIRPQIYGLPTYGDLFTPRQLVALTTFSDLVGEARERATQDALAAGLPDDDVPLAEGGTGARAYGEAIATYLAFAVDKMTDYHSDLCSWHSGRDTIRNTFGRQAIPMVWDFAEANPMSDSTGNFNGAIEWVVKVLEIAHPHAYSKVTQHDATAPPPHDTTPKLISTDPPYYDNIGYADLADFFYVWLRRSLSSIYPTTFSTLLVPKAQELVATPYRFDGSKQKAQAFFEAGLGKAFNRMHEISHADYPLTVYYAFKQAETDQKGKSDESIASTGWETMLEGLIKADFTIDGTWPMRSELSNRMVASGTNALASSIVLVCRPRPADAPKITRRQFLTNSNANCPPPSKRSSKATSPPSISPRPASAPVWPSTPNTPPSSKTMVPPCASAPPCN
jgi:putative DNA methylase